MKFKFSLGTRLTVLYSALMILLMASFAIYSYFSISSKLRSNLDSSLLEVATSLNQIIEKRSHTGGLNLPEENLQGNKDKFALFKADEINRFVGPLRPTDKPRDKKADESQVWSAIMEHILLKPKNYFLQIADSSKKIIWRSKSMQNDSLPVCLKKLNIEYECQYDEKHAQIGTENMQGCSAYLDYSFRGEEARMFISCNRFAVLTVAYPMQEIDVILSEIFVIIIIAFPILLVISVVLGTWLSRISLKSFDEITRTANDITAKNLSLRLSPPQFNDEVGRLIITFNQMIERLESSFAQIRQFTSDASHELRTPLTILRGELELALHRRKTPEEYEMIIASSLDEVIRLTSVVESLLELSRADSGNIRLEFKAKDLAVHFKDIIEDLSILAEAKEIVMRTEIPASLECEYDYARMHQAIINIVDNAIKYTPAGGNVSVGLGKDDEFAIITVKDSGMGMGQQELSHIFDRFYRVDRARSKNIKGTGLGLSIVKWIVDAHLGKIIVESKVSAGTTFTIRIPLKH